MRIGDGGADQKKELETVENLFNLIKDKKINPLEEDRKAWKLTKDGHFLVKSSFRFFGGGERDKPLSKWVSLLGKLGGGKSINNGSTQEEGFLPCKQVPFV